MQNLKSNSFYKQLPEDQRALAQNFQESHPQKMIQIEDLTWRYFDSETMGPALLLLHGGFADFSMWMHQIREFEQDFRVFAPTCPILPHATMSVYTHALKAILEASNVGNVNVMGYSEGGLVAQCFLRDNSHHIESAVLAHTFYPTPESKYYRYDFNLFRILPAPLTEWIFRAFAQPDQEELAADTEWQAWFRAYFKELKSKLTKGIILTHIDLMIDFVRNYSFKPDDLAKWDGNLLITVSADDVVYPYFKGMKRLYPMAETHVFDAGLGAHSIALISPDNFNQTIRNFLPSVT